MPPCIFPLRQYVHLRVLHNKQRHIGREEVEKREDLIVGAYNNSNYF